MGSRTSGHAWRWHRHALINATLRRLVAVQPTAGKDGRTRGQIPSFSTHMGLNTPKSGAPAECKNVWQVGIQDMVTSPKSRILHAFSILMSKWERESRQTSSAEDLCVCGRGK